MSIAMGTSKQYRVSAELAIEKVEFAFIVSTMHECEMYLLY